MLMTTAAERFICVMIRLGAVSGRRVSGGWLGLGCLGVPGVQPLADFLWGIGAAAALIPGDHHPGRCDTGEGRQAQYFQPAHLLRLDRDRWEHHAG